MSSRLQKEDDENSWSWSGLALTGALVGGIGALFGYFVSRLSKPLGIYINY